MLRLCHDFSRDTRAPRETAGALRLFRDVTTFPTTGGTFKKAFEKMDIDLLKAV